MARTSEFKLSPFNQTDTLWWLSVSRALIPPRSGRRPHNSLSWIVLHAHAQVCSGQPCRINVDGYTGHFSNDIAIAGPPIVARPPPIIATLLDPAPRLSRSAATPEIFFQTFPPRQKKGRSAEALRHCPPLHPMSYEFCRVSSLKTLGGSEKGR